jgi:hypothetical protein
MVTPGDSERQNRLVWIVLAALGAFLCIAGWYRWIM